jgi:N-acetyl-anhydromuramyl-L-alanine amidase AmpD
MRQINTIIIHCSDSEWGDAKEIEKWHTIRGWSMIGYHYVILNGSVKPGSYDVAFNGNVEVGRPVSMVGAHCKQHNVGSIGICLIGKDKFTPIQFFSLLNLLDELCAKYDIKKENVYPHKHFDKNKTCPNFEVTAVTNLLFSKFYRRKWSV